MCRQGRVSNDGHVQQRSLLTYADFTRRAELKARVTKTLKEAIPIDATTVAAHARHLTLVFVYTQHITVANGS